MTYKDSTPTFNTGNRKIVNYKDFIQHEPQEEAELKKMKRQFKKADQVKAVNQDHQSKYNKVTHKNDDLVKAEVQDKLDALEEGIFSDRYKDEPFSEEPKKVKLSNNNNLLTNEEKIWLKNWLEYCNQQWGFEPKDHENRRSIFSKLDIN